MAKADLSLTLCTPGDYSGGGISTRHEATGVEVYFTEPFCSLHPSTSVANDRCPKCASNFRDIALDEAQRRARIDCTHLNHTHECQCYLGHDCDMVCDLNPENVRKESSTDEDGNPCEPNPFLVLAAEAPSKPMLGVYTRLSALEEENAMLKAVLGKVIAILPEETREALGSPEVLLRTEG